MRRVFHLIFSFLLIISVAVGTFLALALETRPLVDGARVPSVDDAIRAKELGGRVWQVLQSSEQTAVLRVKEVELDSLMALGGRGVPWMSGRSRRAASGLSLELTARLPGPLSGVFLNARLQVPSEARRLEDCLFNVGRLRIPVGPARWALSRGMDLAMGGHQAGLLLSSMESLELDREGVSIGLRDVPLLRQRLQELKQGLSRIRDKIGPGQGGMDKEKVREYLGVLGRSFSRESAGGRVQLADCLGELFRHAAAKPTGDAIAENQAALLALALFLGGAHFEPMVGTLVQAGPALTPPKVLLGGREDLALHFAYSAGLKLLTDQGITLAIGEIKELVDAGKGGSGFSFVDLAADRTGIRFAASATASEAGALKLRALLAGRPQEQLFFPFVADLPEGMSQAQFEKTYGGVDGPGYLRMVRDIDMRIDDLPAFRNLR